MKKFIVSVTNDLNTDQRVHRTCCTLINAGFDVVLVGRKLPNSLPLNRVYKTKRMRLLFNKGFLFYAEYNLRLFFFLLFNKKTHLFANDVDTLIPNYLVSKIQNKPLVFDSHELFSEVPELVNRPLIKFIWGKIEDYFIPKLKYNITVSDSIANYYLQKYNSHFEVIRNVPIKKEVEDDKATNIKLNNNAIIYQGALNKGRGIELMIETMSYLNDVTLYIVGTGDISDDLKQLVKSKDLSKKIYFLGKVLPNELAKITKQASVGISLEEDLGLNYRYALPNKLFDYIQAKIPVLVSDFPEMKNLVLHYKVGEIITKRSPEKIAEKIKLMLNNKNCYQNNLEITAEELCWEKEKVKLKTIIKKIEIF